MGRVAFTAEDLLCPGEEPLGTNPGQALLGTLSFCTEGRIVSTHWFLGELYEVKYEKTLCKLKRIKETEQGGRLFSGGLA